MELFARGQPDFADVVQRRGARQLVELLAADAEAARDRHRVSRDAVCVVEQVGCSGAHDVGEDVVGLLARAGRTAVPAGAHPFVPEL
ncbi:MAG: hypothetical protein ACLP50_14825 [Solirubrobacteraceae bacterium]